MGAVAVLIFSTVAGSIFAFALLWAISQVLNLTEKAEEATELKIRLVEAQAKEEFRKAA